MPVETTLFKVGEAFYKKIDKKIIVYTKKKRKKM